MHRSRAFTFRIAIAITAATAALAFGEPASAVGPKAYVGNFKDDSVSVIDTASRAVIATVPVAAGPDGIVISADGATAFVAGSSASSVSVIETASDRAAPAIEVGKGPQGLALTPDGRTLLVAVNGEDKVALVDLASRRVSGSIAVAKPHTIAVRADGKLAYVASQEPGHFALVVVDLATRATVATIALDKPPRDLEFGHDGKALYFTLAGVAAIQVLDPTTNTIAAQVATGVSPHVVQHFAGMREAVAVVQGPSEVLLFDPATKQATRHIAVQKQPHWLDLSADAKTLFVTNEGSNSVSVVDLASGDSSTVAVGNAPRKIAVQRGAAQAHASAHGAAAAVKVSIANFAFVPAQLTVKAGARVTWSNDDGAPHGVRFSDGSAGQDLMLPGQIFSRTFDKPGVYDYVCSVHPYMTARVTVQ